MTVSQKRRNQFTFKLYRGVFKRLVCPGRGALSEDCCWRGDGGDTGTVENDFCLNCIGSEVILQFRFVFGLC